MRKEARQITLSSALQAALKGFVPVFGNAEDIQISRRLVRLHAKLKTIDCTLFRELQQKKKSVLTPKMQEIQKEEQYLTQQILKRNFDF